MKKTIKFILLLSITVLTIIMACKKTTNVTVPTVSLNQVFAGLRPVPQNLSVNAGRDTVVYGTNGTILHVYNNSFKDANGNILTSGTVQLQLTEMYKPGDFIENRTSTLTTDGKLLTSGGEINLVATMNGQTVYANKYGIGFKQSAASSDSMQLFFGNSNNADSVVNWVAGNNTSGGTNVSGTVTVIDTADYYLFDSCTGFNRVNCDQYYGNAATVHTGVSVVVPDSSFNSNNTEIWISFISNKAYIAINMYNPATNTFSINFDGSQIPVGLNYVLLAVTNNNGNWYYFEQAGVTSNGMVVNAIMQPESEGYIISRMTNL